MAPNIQGYSVVGLDVRAMSRTTSLTVREEFGEWMVLEKRQTSASTWKGQLVLKGDQVKRGFHTHTERRKERTKDEGDRRSQRQSPAVGR